MSTPPLPPGTPEANSGVFLSLKRFAVLTLLTILVMWALARWVFGDPPAEAARVTAWISAMTIVPVGIESLRGRRFGIWTRGFVGFGSAVSVMVLWRLLGLPRGSQG